MFKWLKMKDYGNKIVRKFVVSTYAKKKFNVLVIMIATMLVRCIIGTLLCTLFITYNLYIDLY